MNIHFANQFLAELQKDGGDNYFGGKKTKTKYDTIIENSLNKAKTPVEFIFCIFKYAKNMAMVYPSTFIKLIEKHYTKDISNAFKIQSHIEYYLGVDKLSNRLNTSIK